jgi:release factor glutamine methyltransferase
MSRAKTIQDFIRSDIIDIEELLCLALNYSKSLLYANPNHKISASELAKLDLLIQKRESGEPFAYLSGTKGFYHLDFKVTNDTLIPRPETELLIDIALGLFREDESIKMLDLGTGSGIIAITLADKCGHWKVSATDQSEGALEVAKENAQKTKTVIEFSHGSWFEAVPNQCFDLIISNPPYVQTNDPHLEGLQFEPIEALISGADGLEDIRMIIDQAPKQLSSGGYLLLEHGYNQQREIMRLMRQSFSDVRGFSDNNGVDRAVLGRIK